MNWLMVPTFLPDARHWRESFREHGFNGMGSALGGVLAAILIRPDRLNGGHFHWTNEGPGMWRPCANRVLEHGERCHLHFTKAGSAEVK